MEKMILLLVVFVVATVAVYPAQHTQAISRAGPNGEGLTPNYNMNGSAGPVPSYRESPGYAAKGQEGEPTRPDA